MSFLNHYFASVFSPDDGNQPSLASEDKANLVTHPDPSLTEVTLSTSEIEEILRNLNPNKATGPDGITTRILKETAEEIASLLSKLFNKPLRLGLLPNDWKLANIVPVYKKDGKKQVENYRSITLLSLLTKGMERNVFNNIRTCIFSRSSASQQLLGRVIMCYTTGRSTRLDRGTASQRGSS